MFGDDRNKLPKIRVSFCLEERKKTMKYRARPLQLALYIFICCVVCVLGNRLEFDASGQIPALGNAQRSSCDLSIRRYPMIVALVVDGCSECAGDGGQEPSDRRGRERLRLC